MFDMHYDLLTLAYVCYVKQDFTYLKNWCSAYREDNVKGVFANLYFMSKEEMIEELDPNYVQETVPIIDMFKISKEIIETVLPNTKILYSIEGCDYLEVEELEALYEAGLHSILPVWNEENKYASGNRSKKGLTEAGKKLLDQAITLGIGIDLSHANENSFFDIINYIKTHSNKEEVVVYASHSNARDLCTRTRNLTVDEIKALQEVGGTVGVFANRNFVVEEKDQATPQQQTKYLAHINYMVKRMGIDHVALATDDMDFCKEADPEYGHLAIFPYQNISSEIHTLLETTYSEEECQKLLYTNAENIYNKLINKKLKRRRI